MEEVATLGPPLGDSAEDYIQVDSDNDVIEEVEEHGVLKPSMNNLKMKPVLPYDRLSYNIEMR